MDFPFIVSSGPQVPKDPALRTIIRKQAMKDVGIARKKRGNYGRSNMRQIPPADEHTVAQSGEPVSSDSSDGVSSSDSRKTDSTSPKDESTSTDATTPDGIVLRARPAVRVRNRKPFEDWIYRVRANPQSAYEALRSKYRIDIQDLSILTTFNVGQTTMSALAEQPELLMTLIGHKMPTYLQYIPSRYGHNPALTAVVDCVIAKVHSAMYPDDLKRAYNAMKLYSKALREMQSGIADPISCFDPDLLCAVEMLSIYELLDPGREEAYIHHIDGAERMMRHRRHLGFKTEFEQKLFLAHIGPAFDRAMYGHKACYLEGSEWLQLYHSMAQETTWLSEKSELVIKTRSQLLRAAGIMALTNRAMDPGAALDGGLLLTTELQVRSAHYALSQCLQMYKEHLFRTSMLIPDHFEVSLRREMHGMILECLGISKRVIAAICDEERLAREVEVQEIAVKLLKLKEQPAQRHSWLYGRLEHEIAAVLQATRHEWEEDLTGCTPQEKRLAACKRWDAFNSCFSREDITLELEMDRRVQAVLSRAACH